MAKSRKSFVPTTKLQCGCATPHCVKLALSYLHVEAFKNKTMVSITNDQKSGHVDDFRGGQQQTWDSPLLEDTNLQWLQNPWYPVQTVDL